jgi:hypothetical protein
MASWVVVADRSLVKYADKKFVEVQTEWKPLVTITAVPLYKLMDPGSGVRPISVSFRACCSSGKDQ